MGGTPGAPTGEHQPDRPTGQKAGQSPVVAGGTVAQVMVGGDVTLGEPVRRGGRADRTWRMDEDEFPPGEDVSRARSEEPVLHRARSVAGPAHPHQQDPVRLAQTPPRPGRRMGIGLVDDEAVLLLEGVEPSDDRRIQGVAQRHLGCVGTQCGVDVVGGHPSGGPETLQRSGQLHAELRGNRCPTGGNDRHRLQRSGHHRPGGIAQKVASQGPVQIEHNWRVTLPQRPEGGGGETQQQGIPNRADGRRPGRAEEERSLAHDLPRAELAAGDRVAVAEGLHPPVGHHVHGVGRTAFLDDGRPRREADRLEMRQELCQRVTGQLAEHFRRCQELDHVRRGGPRRRRGRRRRRGHCQPPRPSASARLWTCT